MLNAIPKIGKVTLAVLVGLFLISLLARLPGILTSAPQPDERHWVSRSAEVNKRLLHKPWELTTHLGHPGIIPALSMALGQDIAKRINIYRGKEKGEPGYIYLLHASRVANAIISSFLASVVFLIGISLVSWQVAFLAAILVALDPLLSGFSAWAHLDTILTLLVTLTTLTYVTSVQRNSLILKLLAGVFWGLSIATKPTAAMLIPGFLLYRTLRYIGFLKKPKGERVTLLDWSDVGTLVLGQVVFCSIYTRLWTHLSDYKVRLDIHSRLADSLWHTGQILQQHALIFLMIMLVLVGLAVFLFRQKHSKVYNHLAIALSYLVFICLSVLLFPQVLENLIRFWTWVSGLSHTAHTAYGVEWANPRFGYLGLMFSRMPTLALLGIGIFAIYLIVDLWRDKFNEEQALNLFLAIVPLAFLAFLNTSNKQTWRYALPIVPLLYLMAAIGYTRIIKLTAQASHKCAALISLLIIFQLYNLCSWLPYQSIFFNSLGGGLAQAVAEKHLLPIQGQTEVLNYLTERSKIAKQTIYVNVIGDTSSLEYSAIIENLRLGWDLKLGFFEPSSSDYVVTFSEALSQETSPAWQEILRGKPDYLFQVKGVTMARVYAVPLQSGPLKITARRTFHHTGDVIQDHELHSILVARPNKDKAGHIMFNDGVRLKKGSYNMHINIGLNNHFDTKPNLQAVRVEFNKDCIKDFLASDILGQRLDFTCNLATDTRIFPRIYWYGLAPIIYSGIEIKPLPT